MEEGYYHSSWYRTSMVVIEFELSYFDVTFDPFFFLLFGWFVQNLIASVFLCLCNNLSLRLCFAGYKFQFLYSRHIQYIITISLIYIFGHLNLVFTMKPRSKTWKTSFVKYFLKPQEKISNQLSKLKLSKRGTLCSTKCLAFL